VSIINFFSLQRDLGISIAVGKYGNIEGLTGEETYSTIARSISFTPLGLIFNLLHKSLAMPCTSST